MFGVVPKCDFYSYLFGFLSKNMALRLEAYPPDNTSCRGPVQVIGAGVADSSTPGT